MPGADLRHLARAAFQAAVARADPARAVQDCFAVAPPPPPDPGGRVFLIAIGKAAPAMMRAALPFFAAPVALCVTHHGNAADLPGIPVLHAGHPVPDAAGAQAAAAILTMLADTHPEDRVIALISGGGSALVPAPPEGVSLADKQALNRLLLAGGLDIVAMNTIRQQVSDLKGGGLLRHAAPAPVSAYILSDVVGDDLRAIASGPTVAPLGTRAEALQLLETAGLTQDLPPSIRAHLTTPDAPRPKAAAANHLIGSNGQSVQAAAATLSGDVIVTADPLVGDVADAAAIIARTARETTAHAVLWGGETTVRLHGTGRGGRNQELALRVAALLDKTPPARPWVFLSGGTDGRDGPTDAAGGLVDAGTLGRVRSAGQDLGALLDNNDSYAALHAADDLLMTGATGTNVADVQVLLLA